MSDIVIKCEDISKQYRLGVLGSRTVGQDLNRWWAKMRGISKSVLKCILLNKLNRINREFCSLSILQLDL
jgi:lipopolysaccharide transport system ATP-binding protein